MPTFSVVMAAYNAERTIAATLGSVFAQSRSDYEIVVVDDGSTDRTAEAVEDVADDRVRLVRTANAGVAAARNAGIASARGRYVSFIDADDLWLPSYLESMGAALDGRPTAGFAFTDAWVWDERVGRFGRQTIMSTGDPPETVPEDPRALFRLLVERNFVFTAATVRSDVLSSVGGFDTGFTVSEDWHLWLRIAAHGYGAVRAAPVLAVYRIRRGSLSSNRTVMRDGELCVLRAALDSAPDDEVRALVRRRLSEVERRVEPSNVPKGRERFTSHLPPALRLRSYRLRPPANVPRGLIRLLREG